jgi:hypothetical protein
MSKKNTNKHIIWSNYNLNLDDWIDDIKAVFDEQGFDYSDWTESKFHEVFTDKMYEANNEYFHDEQENLNIPTEGRIIAIVDLGLWNGRRMGYKFKAEKNIRACLSFDADCGYGEWWVDSHNNLRSRQTHHDGTNFLLYREVKPEISPEQLSNFCWKLYRGKATSKDITKYTRSLGKRVKDVYGW